MTSKPAAAKPSPLEKLLQRGDIWRGHSQHFTSKPALTSGYPALDEHLLNKGWPIASMIEIAQPSPGHGDWLLFMPVLKQVLAQQACNHAVLLNPPATPFAQGMAYASIPLEQLLIVQTGSKNDFIASFVELAQAISCSLLLAWQPRQAMSYTELRKCQLAAAAGTGLCVLFRNLQAQQQSSPASLRLSVSLGKQALQINILKQRGQLRPPSTGIELALPDHLLRQLPHRQLNTPPYAQTPDSDQTFALYQPRRNVLALKSSGGRHIRVKRSAR